MIHTIGSINCDFTYQLEHLVQAGDTVSAQTFTRHLGGKGINQSIAALKAGAKLRHFGAIGEGDEWCIGELARFGVDTSNIQLRPCQTGHAIIQLDQRGENAIIIHHGANAQLPRDQIRHFLAETNHSDWLMLQGEVNDTRWIMDEALANGLQIAFTPAPFPDTIASLPLERLAIVLVNQLEHEQLAAALDPARLHAISRRVVTLGSQGAILYDKNGRFPYDPYPVHAVDTTGAGDCFAGNLVAALDRGEQIGQAMRVAICASALSVTRLGAAQSMPSLETTIRAMNAGFL
ncbi:MAG: ribokinase [Pseudomonadota bacterium]